MMDTFCKYSNNFTYLLLLKNINEKMYEKPHFQRLRKNLLHSFICVILIGIQVIAMNFRNAGVNVSSSFTMLKMTLEDGKNINENVCRRIAKLMLIKLFFLLKSWADK